MEPEGLSEEGKIWHIELAEQPKVPSVFRDQGFDERMKWFLSFSLFFLTIQIVYFILFIFNSFYSIIVYIILVYSIKGQWAKNEVLPPLTGGVSVEPGILQIEC